MTDVRGEEERTSLWRNMSEQSNYQEARELPQKKGFFSAEGSKKSLKR